MTSFKTRRLQYNSLIMLRIKGDSLTFDDLLLVPKYSEILPVEAQTHSRLTASIQLNIPLLSAAMDTVTESDMAIAIAKAGGLGIIHKNMSIEKQCQESRKVKKHESGIVHNPITIHQQAGLDELRQLTANHGISGVPVVEKKGSSKLVGIITSRDFRFENKPNQCVKDVMTAFDNLIVVSPDIEPEKARQIMHKHRIEKLLLVKKDNSLCGMMTLKDLENEQRYPNACKDKDGRLRMGASIGTDDTSIERAEALVKTGVDLLVMDTAHAHSKKVLDTIKICKKKFPETPIIGGNIATAEAAAALVKAGVDSVKIGIGPGTICTTRIVTGVGASQLSAIAEVAHLLSKKHPDVTVIADGGIRYSGDIAKALAAGAHSIMAGSLFAGTDEAPGEIVLYQGRSYKRYRGMGSLSALKQGSNDRYFQHEQPAEKLVPEGVEGMVPNRGPVNMVIEQLIGGLRSAMGYLGCPTIEKLHTETEFVRITKAGMQESHVHDVQITSEAPNYHKE